ncbi:glycoside hydrolase superfamily [Pseudomassariella vexata]|uniref:chitinase n=1 Tax=Pseudomassariella vexata TaxID=1141098 RepID=A0A1Y2DSA0_9PEZI|nr:glycoside hydrolase superfamily [Pseudomassariella vexata]ORY62151.1 glycoside hydrolase superfamily [Pseudomassariella vexata]
MAKPGKNAYGIVQQFFIHKKNNPPLKTFASSAVKMMVDYSFDGLDIDWEYPADSTEPQYFVTLLEACRNALDSYSSKQHFDYKNMMAYDYAGGFDESSTGHQSNIFKDGPNPNATKFNTDDAIKSYLSQGIDPQKINLGLPLYGRSFEATKGIGRLYSGVVASDADPPGTVEEWDDIAKESYSIDHATGELITYDNVRAAEAKL